jgi:hypothetical protein
VDQADTASAFLTGESATTPVDEFVVLRDRMRVLRLREEEMRETSLAGKVRLRGNQHEVSIKLQHFRLLQRGLVPAQILRDLTFWKQTAVLIVNVPRCDGA